MIKKNIYNGLAIILFGFVSTNTIAQKEFTLSEVKLLKSPFLNAEEVDLKYILALDTDRLMAPYLTEAGIKPIKESYKDWESVGLGGQTAGHYLSALSLMIASTGNIECSTRLDYMLDWLEKCQQKNGNGYISGTPGGQKMWEEIERGQIKATGFSLNDKWVPLYNLHKLYAGLHDAYFYTNNKKALAILIRLTDWFYTTTQNLSDDQMQEILKAEHGGLNEVFAQVAAITGDKKYLALAKRVSDRSILDPLIEHQNHLTGKHANTQIPKIIGFKTIADATNNVDWNSASIYFWNTVIDKWTVSIGGNSVNEHFHPTDDFSKVIESNTGPETCNTYNMLKLTKLLYLSDPDTKYMDYYEKAIFNHILSSENPTKGGFVYFTPMRPNHYRVYSQPQNNSWCCVGTGMENHAKYGEMIYAQRDNNLYVNLFIASELDWKEKGFKLNQETQFPYEDFTVLKIKEVSKSSMVLKIRKPSWTTDNEIEVSINGKKVKQITIDKNYITVNNKWKKDDEIKITLPMHIALEYLPDGSPCASIKYGPIVLAAKSGTDNLDGLFAADGRGSHVARGALYPINEAPAIISEARDFSSKISPLDLKHLTFQMPDLIFPSSKKNLVLQPFFEIHEARYQLYFPVYTIKEFEVKKEALKQEENRKLALEKRTLDQIAPGEQQPEGDHNFKGEKTNSGIHSNRHWRDASGWFSYELTDKKNEASLLQIMYYGLDKERTFDIFLNNTKLETVTLKGDKGSDFFVVDYAIPQKIKDDANGKFTIKFAAAPNSRAGGIFHIRLLKN